MVPRCKIIVVAPACPPFVVVAVVVSLMLSVLPITHNCGSLAHSFEF